mmetsp:Transcript_5920/g.36711  ORF Transcript_5920/g.36711 Transcript_5920/m.36711 type:complete len:238 (+) Transcript_5920:1364-2077(+)
MVACCPLLGSTRTSANLCISRIGRTTWMTLAPNGSASIRSCFARGFFRKATKSSPPCPRFPFRGTTCPPMQIGALGVWNDPTSYQCKWIRLGKHQVGHPFHTSPRDVVRNGEAQDGLDATRRRGTTRQHRRRTIRRIAAALRRAVGGGRRLARSASGRRTQPFDPSRRRIGCKKRTMERDWARRNLAQRLEDTVGRCARRFRSRAENLPSGMRRERAPSGWKLRRDLPGKWSAYERG